MFPLTHLAGSGYNGRMATDTNTSTNPTEIIARNLAGIADRLAGIEPDELSRPELLATLGAAAASVALSSAQLMMVTR